MALKMAMKDVNDSNVEDHNRIKAKELTEPEAEPEPITLTIAITMTMSLTLTTTTTTMTTIINVDNHFIDVNYGNKNHDRNDEKVPMGTVPRKPKVSEWQTTFSLQ